MYRPDDDVLWVGFQGCDARVAMRAAKWLLLLCLAWLVLLIATFQPMFHVRRAAHVPPAKPATGLRAATPLPVPEVEAMEPMALTPAEAQAFNVTVPFIDGPISPARKFVYAGSGEDRERALTCLASAAWYEAGDDKLGEQAVAQVVLNRARHPAFPRTICGVVFQGASRRTGCQFTFTCDGSLRREPSADAWQRAREVAERALSGYVFKTVGNATHYHTDWVVPYWSDTLDKLAEVHSHIFYRWRGDWGRAAAFAQRPGGAEPLDPRIAGRADPQVVDMKLADKAGVILAKTADGRQHLIAPVAQAAPVPQTTILPLPPATIRRLLPAVGVAANLPAVEPAANRSWPPQRKQMSFNQPGEAVSPAAE